MQHISKTGTKKNQQGFQYLLLCCVYVLENIWLPNHQAAYRTQSQSEKDIEVPAPYPICKCQAVWDLTDECKYKQSGNHFPLMMRFIHAVSNEISKKGE